jgi:KUP system potassium uptake protein
VTDPKKPAPTGRYLMVLAITALGVVYGDIGTSPLYAIRESFHGTHGIAPSPENVLGVLSLIFWALIIVISIKYLIFVLMADNRGEGGMIALTALVAPPSAPQRGHRWLLTMAGLFGASLLYGDGMITPAISVLSAVEGLKVATPLLQPYIIPITIAILVGLFAVQSRGTGGVGKVFGPITMIWFITLAVLGIGQIVQNPSVFAAINPMYGASFFARNGWQGYLVLGSVFLVVTGGEALYADMGHFGKRPIRLTWVTSSFPALALNYFGQGALIIRDPVGGGAPVLPHGAAVGDVPAGRARHDGDGDRVAGGDLGGVLAHAAGGAARLPAAHGDRAHLAREMGQIYIPA